MDAYDFVQLAFLAVGGTIRGKTKLQKTVYFLGIMTKEIGNLGYGPHFYGPYSSEVADATGQLHTLGFLDRNTVQTGLKGAFGFEATRYDFTLTEAGKKIAAAKSEAHSDTWAKIKKAAEDLKEAGDIDYMEMSIAAKTYFMLGGNKNAVSPEELAKLAPRFGWTVNEDQISEAVSYLRKLELVG